MYSIKTEQLKQEELAEKNRSIYQGEIEHAKNEIPFEPFFKTNEDFVAWIEIPETNISHPVVQGKDNSYYLNHDFKKEKNREGSIFLDYRNTKDFRDKNTVIYGHHTDQGTMFTNLSNYKSVEFYEENPTFYLDSPYGKITYEVFAAYVAREDFYYIQTDFIYEKHFTSFLKEIMKRSIYPNKEVPKNMEHIITLSTCSYEFKDAKFVVHAREVEREMYE